ncbi:activator-dependent family glycosyltransferase [Solwaraspora sp. WMMD1047]|uniref:activator-dependent family glycosyltransferase n=1 Tax=Solwaraspora sp. WMMD1047 TaxID=3016102 RepID=UPI002416A481|nr:activator-dependent family glycosyltransferase [Solwaraspora sp. WMMD1047]MDG4827784.1 activator-dependent family glycosyltransferase [Solwaraspora sp. WMMD1047]
MRIIFATYSEKTHFWSMVPLAWALRNAGHEVVVASQPALADAITATGLTAVPVGTDHRFHQVMRRTGRLTRDDPLPFDFARPTEQLSWEYLRDGYRQFVPWWCRLVNDTMVDDLVGFCQRWRPDLVLWEPVSYAGSIAATAIGVTHARVMWSVDLFTRMRRHFLRLGEQQPADQRCDPLADWLGTRVGRYGGQFSEVMTTGHFTIDTVPDSLRHDPRLDLDLDHRYLPMRYIPYNGTSVVPPWLRTPPQRPRVALTLGTSGSSATERQHGHGPSAAEILRAVAALPVEVVAMLPPSQRDQLEAVPDNVRLVDYAPLNVLAPTCAAVIHHGGNGTWSTTLVHGVPQLVLPNMFDLSVRGRYLADQGAGLTMESHEVTAAAIGSAVARLLDEPDFARNAARLADEMRALPTPRDLVPQIEKLTS